MIVELAFKSYTVVIWYADSEYDIFNNIINICCCLQLNE